MRKSSILLLVGALAIAASLLVGPTATAGPDRASAGTVVFIHDQEPPNLQGPWVGNNLYATALVLNNIWYGGQIRDDKADFQPRLFTAAPKVTKQKPLTITATYKKEAVWSDGKPVTGADFKATWGVFINPKFNVISRTGWEDIKSVTVKGKTIVVVFKTSYADWESLISAGVYAAHIIKGQDMNQMFLNSVPVSSGPWLFDSWQKGVQLAVKANTKYGAGPKMKLDRVVFRYILDTNARFQALKAGEGQVMEPQPQLQIADFLSDKKFVVNQKIGYAWEHVDIQFGPQGHVALKQPYVRNALITGMNRTQVASALYATIAPGLPALQSHMFKPFETTNYRKNWAVYKFNQQSVIDKLEKKGCTGGPSKPAAGNQAIFSCPNVGKLSFRYATTTGNQLRALTFEIFQRQLKSVGIELVARFQVAGTLFGTTLPSGDWDLIMFTWVGSPATPITIKDLYACGGEQNYMNYCNKKLSAILNKVANTLSASERAKMLNGAELKYMVKDIPSIPVYARPVYVIHAAGVKGPVVNPTTEGSPWNAAAWTA
jgi:peptide/nickel transport system substrate-binding protein